MHAMTQIHTRKHTLGEGYGRTHTHAETAKFQLRGTLK